MGCFSFLCKECGEPILSDSFSGDPVKLFLLKEGKVLQEMEGEYDSYGRVFTEDLSSNQEWLVPVFPEQIDSTSSLPVGTQIWGQISDMMFNGNPSSGIAAVHSRCFTGAIPVTQSDNDPGQGWGSDDKITYDEIDEIDF